MFENAVTYCYDNSISVIALKLRLKCKMWWWLDLQEMFWECLIWCSVLREIATDLRCNHNSVFISSVWSQNCGHNEYFISCAPSLDRYRLLEKVKVMFTLKALDHSDLIVWMFKIGVFTSSWYKQENWRMWHACFPYETDKMMCCLVSCNLLLVFVEQNHMKS